MGKVRSSSKGIPSKGGAHKGKFNEIIGGGVTKRDEGKNAPTGGGVNNGNSSGIPGDGVEKQFSIPQHPLLLKPVMEGIFQRLGYEDLRSCRRVCKEWHLETLRTWRSTSVITISLDKIQRRDSSGRDRKSSLNVFRKFWNEGQNNCTEKPFRILVISGSHFPLLFTHLDLLREKILPNLSILTLDHCTFSSVAQVRMVMYQTSHNLQSLTMDECSVIGLDETSDYLYAPHPSQNPRYEVPQYGEHPKLKSLALVNCLPDYWINILSHFPSLETLRHPDQETEDLLEVIQIIRTERPGMLPLTNFGIELEICEGAANEHPYLYLSNLLQQLRVSLVKVSLELSDNMNHDTIRGILEHHSKTIMKFDGDGSESQLRFEFPPNVSYPNLKVMCFNTGFTANFNFLQYVRNLETLHADLSNEQDEVRFLFENSMLPPGFKLKELKFVYLNFTMSDEFFKRVMSWIPEVEELRANLSVKQRRAAWANLAQLKSLKAYNPMEIKMFQR